MKPYAKLEARGLSVAVTSAETIDFKTCKTCKEVHFGRIAYSLPFTNYLDGARSLK
jgi:hypothetical protein